MAANLDTAILFGKESTYGTPATLTTAYEGKADSWKREQEVMESTGFRAGMHTKRDDRRKVVNMGGTGSLEFDIQNKGFGFLLQAMLGATTGPTQNASTDAYTQTHSTTADDPGDSYTVQVQRVASGSGLVKSFTHHGSTITGWSISQDVNGFAMASLTFDFEDVDTITADGTPSYPASTSPFDWTQCSVTVDGSSTLVTAFNVDAELGLKTDRRFLRGSELKKRPVRSSVPTFSGSMSAEYEGTTLYDHWVAGDIVPIVATWTGSNIEGAYDYELKITMAACQLTGDSPEASLDDLPSQPVTFDVLHNGSDAAVEIEYTTTDTSL